MYPGLVEFPPNISTISGLVEFPQDFRCNFRSCNYFAQGLRGIHTGRKKRYLLRRALQKTQQFLPGKQSLRVVSKKIYFSYNNFFIIYEKCYIIFFYKIYSFSITKQLLQNAACCIATNAEKWSRVEPRVKCFCLPLTSVHLVSLCIENCYIYDLCFVSILKHLLQRFFLNNIVRKRDSELIELLERPIYKYKSFICIYIINKLYYIRIQIFI